MLSTALKKERYISSYRKISAHIFAKDASVKGNAFSQPVRVGKSDTLGTTGSGLAAYDGANLAIKLIVKSGNEFVNESITPACLK